MTKTQTYCIRRYCDSRRHKPNQVVFGGPYKLINIGGFMICPHCEHSYGLAEDEND